MNGGYLWYLAEYPEDGSVGPFSSEEEARKDAAKTNDGDDPEIVVSWASAKILAEREANYQREERKNYSRKCGACEGLPTVGDHGMCGPCFFGEADTAGGNW